MANVPIIKTKAKLVTSIRLLAYPTDSNGAPSQSGLPIGSIRSITLTETRDAIHNWVIGTADGSGFSDGNPSEIVPGVARTRQLTADHIALYTQNVFKAFGTSGIVSLTQQNAPFDVEEITVDPTSGVATSTKYLGCYITNYTKTSSIDGGDIRILENVTITFKETSHLSA